MHELSAHTLNFAVCSNFLITNVAGGRTPERLVITYQPEFTLETGSLSVHRQSPGNVQRSRGPDAQP